MATPARFLRWLFAFLVSAYAEDLLVTVVLPLVVSVVALGVLGAVGELTIPTIFLLSVSSGVAAGTVVPFARTSYRLLRSPRIELSWRDGPQRHIHLLLKNNRAPDDFIAEVIELSGARPSEYLVPPWPITWKDSEETTRRIMRGSEATLVLGRAYAPMLGDETFDFKTGKSLGRPIHPLILWPHGYEHPISAPISSTLDEAYRAEITLKVRVSLELGTPVTKTVRVVSQRPGSTEGRRAIAVIE